MTAVTLLIFFQRFIMAVYSLHLEFSLKKNVRSGIIKGLMKTVTCGDSLGNIVKCRQQTVWKD